ncbi:hypothetical protein DB347_17900 [Opitutaceae bacterium EW11]|nr:hypothetical protein DB347_17900 [Opitutaceae bacterium EW11]
MVREEQNAEREIAAHVVAAEQESAEAKQAARLKGLAEASPGEFAAALEKDDYGTSLAENLLFRASYIGEAEHGALRGRQAQELLLKLIPRFAEHYSEVRPAIEEHLALARGAAKLLPDQYTAEPIDAFAKILAKTVVESRIGAVLSTRGTPTAAEQRLQQQSGAMMR